MALWIVGQGEANSLHLVKPAPRPQSEGTGNWKEVADLVISKGKEIKIYSLAFQTALVLRDRKKIASKLTSPSVWNNFA